MRLERPFLKLPIRFDAEALAADVRNLPSSAWVAHPSGFEGNEAVRLVTVGGKPTDDFHGEMGPTEQLLACPYIMEVMAELGGVWGRSRLMGLGPGAEVPLHVDQHYYWRTHWRIHIPIITNPAVSFSCGPETVHMAAGECWLFDSFRWHRVRNAGSEQRVHLVIDTVGSERLRQLMRMAREGSANEDRLPPGSHVRPQLRYERMNSPAVMSPWEMRSHIGFLLNNVTPHPILQSVVARLDQFADDWAIAWAQYGTQADGHASYRALIGSLQDDLTRLRGGSIVLNNRLELYQALENMVLIPALDDRASESRISEPPPARLAS